MKIIHPYELPADRRPDLHTAVRLEWLTIAYTASVIVLLYLVMGSSQAMKTAWIEDILSLLPPAAFLLSLKFRDRPPDENFQYGYHRATDIAFLAASLALLVMGVYLLFESLSKLFTAVHPTIGTVSLFGHEVWLGWLMFPVLVWAIVPPYFLGRAKFQPASRLHDKTLFADAKMNKANWTTGLAAAVGVLGIAFGLWWADVLAAALIALSVTWDGLRCTGGAVNDLMDRRPRTVDMSKQEGLPARVATELKKLDWVADAEVRLRESGHIFFGEAYIIPKDYRNLLARSEEAGKLARGLDWRLHDLSIQFLPTFESEEAPRG